MSDFVETGVDPEIKKFLNYLMAIIVAAGSFVFHAVFPGISLLGMWLVLGLSALIGWLVGRVLSHHVDGDGTFALSCACALGVAWVIPFLGILLSSLVSELAEITTRRRNLFLCMSVLCGIASVVNAGAATVRAVSAPSYPGTDAAR
ncbi:MAG TPA: hypothetical protein VFH89_08385 [Sphingomicrobium sp.]|nr:hypothetical protein [Sphingomicrobium sp.]